jgi:hypothetical protein
LEVKGFPDGAMGASITQVVKQQMEISRPTTVPLGSNWDAHIYFTPLSFSRDMKGCQHYGNSFQQTPDITSMNVGGVIAVGANVGGDLTVCSTSPTGTRLLGSLPVPPTYQKHRWRLIAVGIEVHDTTAELSKQGALTVYQLPQSRETFTGLLTSIASSSKKKEAVLAFQGNVEVFALNDLPHTKAQALLLDGSCTWEAKRGAYVVCTMSENENPPEMNKNLVTFTSPSWDSALPNNGAEAGYMTVPDTIEIDGNNFYTGQMDHLVPFNTKGIVLSGVNSSSTFTINVNYWIERFPSHNDADLVVLARPTSEHDPVALEMYSRIMSKMPVGVTVNENGFGDWFFGGVASIVDYLTGTKIASNLNKGLSSLGQPEKKNPNQNTSQQTNNSPNNTGKPRLTIVNSNSKPTSNVNQPAQQKSQPNKRRKKGGNSNI